MTNDLHPSHIEDLLGAYALDAVDPDERELVDAHLIECASCRAEVDEHLEVVAILAGTEIAPSDAAWDAIISELGDLQRGADVLPMQARRFPRAWAANWAAGIAATVAVVLGVGVISQSNRIGDLDTQLAAQSEQIAELTVALEADPLHQAAAAAFESPGATVASLTAEGTRETMVVVVLPDGTGYVYESSLQDLPDDSTYQLWAVIDGKVISAGVLGSRLDVVPFHIDRQGLQGLVITREVAGGVPQSDGEPVVAWFDA